MNTDDHRTIEIYSSIWNLQCLDTKGHKWTTLNMLWLTNVDLIFKCDLSLFRQVWKDIRKSDLMHFWTHFS